MKLRYFEYRKGRVEIIPMIDVMLFLLVFFIIVTLQMIPDAGVNLQLPQASQVQHLPHPKVTVNLLADGTMQVKGQTLDAAGLTALLAADGDPAKTQVTIAADKHVAFQYFVTAMDASRKAGVTDIGVAAQPTGPVASSPQSSQGGPAPSAAAAEPGTAPPATGALPATAPSASGAASSAAAATPSAPTEAPAAPPAAVASPPSGGSPAAVPSAPSAAAPAPAAGPANAPAAPTSGASPAAGGAQGSPGTGTKP